MTQFSRSREYYLCMNLPVPSRLLRKYRFFVHWQISHTTKVMPSFALYISKLNESGVANSTSRITPKCGQW